MSDIRYVCLSDLHFGAGNSILSHLVSGSVHVDPTRVSDVALALAESLRALAATNTTVKPTLVLDGDVLELALASDDVALRVFQRFLEALFPPGEDLSFDPTVIYLPGNHDHHMWESARELQFASFLQRHPDREIPMPWHSTWLYAVADQPPTPAALLDIIAQRAGLNVRFHVYYPNFGVRADDDSRAVIFHHGHYTESIYRLMTTLKTVLFPGQTDGPAQVWDLEAENYAWIDFMWGTLGRSGRVGEDVGLIYDMLQSKKDLKELAKPIADGIASRLSGGGWQHLVRPLLEKGLDETIELALGYLAKPERTTPTAGAGPLSPASEHLLVDYLDGPVAGQLVADHPTRNGPLPQQLSFVFGHTHKPFVETRDVPRYEQPVQVFNTGGWVVDTVNPDLRHGANMVVVSEDLDVAAVRLYSQAATSAGPDARTGPGSAAGPGAYRVRMDDPGSGQADAFYERVAGLIEPEREPWAALSAAVAVAVPERQAALARILADPNAPDVLANRARDLPQYGG